MCEETLEKFRFFGESLTDDRLKIVISDSLVLASNPTGSSENDVELGFSVLFSELESCGRLRRATYESFLLLSSSSNVLPFWCFIQVRHSKGIIIIRVFHPLGEDAARKEAEIARDLVKGVCHRANQALLLKSLHRTKLVSIFLIANA